MIPNYPWLKVVDVRPAKKGEWCIDQMGNVSQDTGTGSWFTPIVEPDNVYGVYRLEDIKIPVGYEPEGEKLKDAFREPSIGASFLACGSFTAHEWSQYNVGNKALNDVRRLCVRKTAPKTKRVLVLESDDPQTIATYERSPVEGYFFTQRIEERPITRPSLTGGKQ